MNRTLPPAFFNRPTLTVAKDLIGKFLVRRVGNKTIALMIVETEAYDGLKDMASHARHGKTMRTTPMFGKPGTIYVYFTYGMHWMLNLVCGEEEYPAAVLIRGLSEADTLRVGVGLPFISPERSASAKLLNGPGKLTKFLKIDKSLNNKMLGRVAGLWVEDRGVKVSPRDIMRTPRIGVDYAGLWAKKPWRFVLRNFQIKRRLQ